MIRSLWILLTILIILAQTPEAQASCYPGGKPDWNDVTQVEIDRCQVVGHDPPCYHAQLLNYASISGDLLADRLLERHGRYTLPDNVSRSLWEHVLDDVRRADFFNLMVPYPTPGPHAPIVFVDAPDIQITVARCHTHLTIDADVVYEPDSDGFRRFITLVDQLNTDIDAFPWQFKDGAVTNVDVRRYFFIP